MANQKKRDIPERLSEGPDDGGPGQSHREQVFGETARTQSDADLRDERGGARSGKRAGAAAAGRSAESPHADTDPRLPPPDEVDAEPEGLERERRDPLSPSRGRAEEPRPSGVSTHAKDWRSVEPDK